LKAEENPGAASGGAALVWGVYRRALSRLSTPRHKNTVVFLTPGRPAALGLIHDKNKGEQEGIGTGSFQLTNRRARCSFAHRSPASDTHTDGWEVSFGETT
jgi:hypothetical protein